MSMNKNTAVDVEVVAEVVGEERAWAGLLTAVFADGSHRARNVSGVTVNSILDFMAKLAYTPPPKYYYGTIW